MESQSTHRDVTPHEAAAATDVGTILVDVREHDEWDAGHVRGARHIPLAEFAERLPDLQSTGVVYIICRSGNRSTQAARLLAATGQPAANVAGGMIEWARSGLPIDTADPAAE